MIRKLNSIIRDGVLQYSISSYLSQILAFVNIYLLATYLSVFEFGIYSFITLILSYLSYSTFGINYSLVNFLSIKSKSRIISEGLCGNSFFLIIVIFILIYLTGIFLISLFPSLFVKYEIETYIQQIFLIAFLNNLNNLFIKIYRVYNTLNKLIFNLLISPSLLFFLLVFKFENVVLIDVMIVMVAARLASFLLFLYAPPVKIKFKFNLRIIKLLFLKGVNLLFYNFSFGLISISTLTIFSYLNSVENFAFYKLSYTLSSIALLIAGAFESLLYPKVFNRVVSLRGKDLLNFLNILSNTYVLLVILLNLALFFLSPLLRFVLPSYLGLNKILFPFLIGNIFLIRAYPIRILLVARGKEFILTYISLISCLIVVVSSLIFYYFELNTSFYSFSFLFACAFFYFYSFKGAIKYGIEYKITGKGLINLLVITLFYILLYLDYEYYIYLFLPILLMVNRKKLLELFKFSIQILLNPKLIKI